MLWIILVFFILLCVFGPNWHGYGYGPGGVLGFILLVLLVIWLLQRIT